MNLSWLDHIMFFLLGILMPILALISARAQGGIDSELELPPKKRLYYTNGLTLWIGAAIVVTSWNVFNKPWDRLGVQYPIIDRDVILMISVLTIIYIIDTVYSAWKWRNGMEKKEDMMKIMPSTWKEYKHFVFLAVSAGVCEEIIFRGFMINYIIELLPSISGMANIAVLISSLIFAVSHMYQGWLNVLKIMTLAILFGGIFIFSKSLVLVIIIHSAVDLLSGALTVMLSKQSKI